MVRDWVVGAMKYGPKPGGHPGGRAGLQGVLEFKSGKCLTFSFLKYQFFQKNLACHFSGQSLPVPPLSSSVLLDTRRLSPCPATEPMRGQPGRV